MEHVEPIRKIDIFIGWGYVKWQTFEYWLHADIVNMVFVDEPTSDEDFFVQADIKVRLRLKRIESDEIIEKSFDAKIGYDKERKTYFVVYWPPNKRKIQGELTHNFCNFKQTFGRATMLLSDILENKADDIAWYIVKKTLTTTQPV
ncbi:MAG: hypothetical protein WCV58_02840 [Patescibacteria group bacterium]|jgi:hypothetical protein